MRDKNVGTSRQKSTSFIPGDRREVIFSTVVTTGCAVRIRSGMTSLPPRLVVGFPSSFFSRSFPVLADGRFCLSSPADFAGDPALALDCDWSAAGFSVPASFVVAADLFAGCAAGALHCVAAAGFAGASVLASGWTGIAVVTAGFVADSSGLLPVAGFATEAAAEALP